VENASERCPKLGTVEQTRVARFRAPDPQATGEMARRKALPVPSHHRAVSATAPHVRRAVWRRGVRPA
jgi:hypothetical protein